VRSAAAKALGDIGDERAAAALNQALEDDFIDVRTLAAWAPRQMRKKK
jgi:HEAT repeat protein